MRPLFALLVSLVLLTGCQKNSKSSSYTIGIDPTWYPLHVPGQEDNVLAFSIELLTQIAKMEDLQMGIVRMNWNNLTWGLQKKKYNAMLSTMRPYTFYLSKYSFSLPYLLTGPVVVLPKKVKSNKIEGKEIGVIRGSPAALILQTTPNILLEGYDSIPEMFVALEREQVDGIALEVLAASNYLRDLYPEKFRIASEPLNNMGLRLVTLHETEVVLMNCFNRGLKRLKKEGTYDKLLKKWGLSPDDMPMLELDKKASAFIQSFFET